jgi:hypothetical protein
MKKIVTLLMICMPSILLVAQPKESGQPACILIQVKSDVQLLFDNS